MTTLTLVLLSLLCLCGTVCCVCYKRPVPALFGCCCTMVLTYLAGCDWRKLLIDSGKDPALLGFARYPVVPITLAIFMLAAIVVMTVSIVLLVRRTN